MKNVLIRKVVRGYDVPVIFTVLVLLHRARIYENQAAVFSGKIAHQPKTYYIGKFAGAYVC